MPITPAQHQTLRNKLKKAQALKDAACRLVVIMDKFCTRNDPADPINIDGDWDQLEERYADIYATAKQAVIDRLDAMP